MVLGVVRFRATGKKNFNICQEIGAIRAAWCRRRCLFNQLFHTAFLDHIAGSLQCGTVKLGGLIQP